MSVQIPPPATHPDSTPTALVAVVAGDPEASRGVRQTLEAAGHRVVEYASGAAAVKGNGKAPNVYLVDLELPDVEGIEVVRGLMTRDPELSVLVFAPSPSSPGVSAAIKAGAYDCVVKPWDDETLVHAVRRAVERRSLVCGVHRLESELREHAAVSTLIGDSPAMRELARQVVRAADVEGPVVVLGERGTGKELVARAIHSSSARKCGPFVSVSCSASPADCHLAELFGRDGASGGARAGRVDEARGGTLYLEEVQLLSPEAQSRLERLIRTHRYLPVGGTEDRPADVRIICGSSVDLAAEVESGTLTSELYPAIAAHPIHLVPLRQRREDIPLLVAHYASARSQRPGAEPLRVSPEVLDAFSSYLWPGNVRELQEVVVRSLLACRGDEITLADIPSEIRRLAPDVGILPEVVTSEEEGPASSRRVVPLRELERRAIEAALRTTQGSVAKAAKLLGIGRATLYRRLASLELQRPPDRAEGE